MTKNAARFEAEDARKKILSTEDFNPDYLRRYVIRPLETRWCYYSPTRPLWNEPRPALWAQCWAGNTFFISRVNASKEDEGSPMYFASALSDDHLLSPDAACFPIQLKANQKPKIEAVQDSLLTLETPKDADALEITANLSQLARDYLIKLGITNPDADAETAGLIWHHALAIGYAPDYLLEHEDGIRNDYPRIPLPKTKELLLESAKLGRQIAQLLDTEVNIDGVTSGKILNELKAIGTIAKVGNGNLTRDELALTVHWGRSTSQGIMPGSGKLETRAYASDEKILKDLELGEETIDVYLNDVAYWRCIPERVWEYAIGGYQVIKKWLSYRDQSILERPITPEEAREVTAMSRRIAALLMLEPELNRNYRAVSSSENEDEIEASNA